MCELKRGSSNRIRKKRERLSNYYIYMPGSGPFNEVRPARIISSTNNKLAAMTELSKEEM
jgi:hypothetical protein